jgi:hypothetical protein
MYRHISDRLRLGKKKIPYWATAREKFNWEMNKRTTIKEVSEP